MSQYSYVNDPTLQNKKMTQNRVLLLSEKINNLKFGQKAESQRKLQSLQKQCQEIQQELQNIRTNFDHQSFDIKNIMDGLQKALNFDYYGIDKMVKDQIKKCEERFIEMTQTHTYDRKQSDARLSKFIEEKTVLLRDLIEKQIHERAFKCQQIQESLQEDLKDIKAKLQQEKQASSSGLQAIHQQFLIEYEKMQHEFDSVCQKSSENQGQFYRMLKQILKKVKDELGEDKLKREQMQETILMLIQKICDKAIQEVGV